jgi:hypothetical protein
MAQAINNTNIREAVEKYCNDYYCTDTFTVTRLTRLFTNVGAPPTPAQAKIIFGDMDMLRIVVQLTVWSMDICHEYCEIGMALVEVLKLKEPCFLSTFLNAQADKLFRIIPISRYLLVCTEEAARNVLKSFDAYTIRANQLEKAYFKRVNEVYEYALYTTAPAEQFSIRNAYMAAWYILTDSKPIIQLEAGRYSTKQLKDAISNVQAIDRYAMIKPRDYDDIITQQGDILHTIKTALFKVNAKMHVFKHADELAEEGIRMGNCIATYWAHDASSCLFSVDYRGEHMDVELIKDWQAEYDKWLPSQVFIANNEVNDTTDEIGKILDEVCTEYNEAAKDEWIATYIPNKEICRQVEGNCVDCSLRYSCPMSLDFVDEEDRFDDEDLEVDDDGFDFEPCFMNEDEV